jgi:phosphoglycerate dehydrogenase-like enzyme
LTIAVLNALIRPLLEPRLPQGIEPRWFASTEELLALAPEAEIGWFDSFEEGVAERAAAAATRMRWLNTITAGIEHFPLAQLAARGVTLSNGAGLNAGPVADYAVMGMLTLAKNFAAVVRAHDRHEWLVQAPGLDELEGSSALIIGAGGIGREIFRRLIAFGVDCTPVQRTPGAGLLGPDQWRARLGEFDWVIVSAPATPETHHMIGADELAAMKPTARLVNVARGSLVDQDALVAALQAKRIDGAFLDVTEPEPLPSDHPLWTFDNVLISMHLSGRAQTRLFARAVDRFVSNCDLWLRGERLVAQVDFARGY